MKKKLRRLPRSKNGTRRKHASFGAFEYQKDDLKRKAYDKGMTVSAYLNFLMWGDWMK